MESARKNSKRRIQPNLRKIEIAGSFRFRRNGSAVRSKLIIHTRRLQSYEHCHCHEHGIFKASLIHTLNITVYIFIITLIIGLVIGLIGEDTIETFIKNNVFLGPVISSLIGLIPNCAASVIITNLYIENVINMASLVSGLLTGAGVGLLVLFRTNKKHLKENLCVVGIMYFVGVVSGLVLQFVV